MKTRGRIAIIFMSVLAVTVMFSQTAALALSYVAATPYVITFQGPSESKVSCEIIKNVSGNGLQQLQIKNTGNVPANVRLRVSGSWVNDEGITVADWEDDLAVNDGWAKDGEYYLYSGVVHPGDTTGSLADAYTPPHRDDGAHLELSFTALADEAAANRA